MDGADSGSVGDLVCRQLTRIGDLLELLVGHLLVPEQAQDTETCPHPPDDRISLGVTNGIAEWECRICRYRHPPSDLGTTIPDRQPGERPM